MASATNVYQRQQRSRDPQLSAEQKLYGPLQVTTAVTDFGQMRGFQAALVDLPRAAEYPKSRA